MSLCGRFLFLLGHCIEGSRKTRQRGSGSNKFCVLAQVPPVASWSPPHLRVLQSNIILLKVKLHWCPNYIGVLARMLLLASRSLRLGLLEDNKTSLKLEQNWCPCTGTSGCFFSVTTLRAPERQGSMAQGQTSFVPLYVLLVSSRSLHLGLLQDKATWLKVKQVSCPCAGASCFFSVTALRAPARQGNVAQGQK